MDFKNGTLPIINGILYADSRTEHYAIRQTANGRELVPEEGTAENAGYVETFAYPNAELTCPDKGIRFAAGEGSWGGDGYILAKSLQTGEMVFLISFEDSNPFVKLERRGDCLYAENNCGEVWQLDIRSSERVGLTIVISGDRTKESA